MMIMEQQKLVHLFLLFSSLLVNCEQDSCNLNLQRQTSEMEILIPDEEVLHSGPGSSHKVRIKVKNLIEDEEFVDLSVSHRENFFNLDDGPHVELVDSITPTKLAKMTFNETREIEIGFKIPSFVAIGRQGKVG